MFKLAGSGTPGDTGGQASVHVPSTRSLRLNSRTRWRKKNPSEELRGLPVSIFISLPASTPILSTAPCIRRACALFPVFLLVRLWLRCLPLTSSTALRLLPITAGMPCVLPNASGPVGLELPASATSQESPDTPRGAPFSCSTPS
ncbi:PREDICTED: uncharacterized protein LOC107544413 isoform X3 [Miniopterus natalensis]|uniref:uncharacterized protein LOC107544413 isoform X3 n=1 Tax=Miniopterus natalensis TaxID=291302 RepID=UPI0007A6D859|nr:PREDICTED: uncharacterized protein LOC107544413 isoform X3 [Miniopterus natalensis]